jgi:hypothetical protein
MLGLIFVASSAFPSAARADIEVVASNSASIQQNGPRAGQNGKNYFNVQGKSNGKEGAYACFGVVDFNCRKPEAPISKVEGLTLTLVQSVPSFAKDGNVKIYLATDTETSIASPPRPAEREDRTAKAASEPADKAASPLKFQMTAADGLGTQFKNRLPVGTGTFKKIETGRVDVMSLSLGDEAKSYLRFQINEGGPIRLLVVPDDDTVAATYFGAGNATESNRPKIMIRAK